MTACTTRSLKMIVKEILRILHLTLNNGVIAKPPSQGSAFVVHESDLQVAAGHFSYVYSVVDKH